MNFLQCWRADWLNSALGCRCQSRRRLGPAGGKPHARPVVARLIPPFDGAGPAANFPALSSVARRRFAHRIAPMNTAPLVAYLVAGFLVLGILLSALAVWLWG